MDKASIIRAAAEFYLQSSDFNGIPLRQLALQLKLPIDEVGAHVRQLVDEDQVTVLGESSVNPNILRLGIPDKAWQLEALEPAHIGFSCVYVRPPALAAFVKPDLYADEPYKRELALGAPQLSHRAFDLMVLEHYRNDPRYTYENSDIDGRISIRDDHDQSRAMPHSDKVFLQSFGFAYDDEMNRAVAVFLRYLAHLSPEHQQIWKSRELTGTFKMHPDYFDMNVLGDWGTNISICDALVAEIRIVNEMCQAMDRPKLFRRDFGKYGEEKPRDFTLLIRPTSKEFHSFVLLLDRMLSDNIDQSFFGTDISFETDIVRGDGKIQVERKGTLRMLDEWLRKFYRTSDWSSWDRSYAALREVRKLRQKPAHALNDDQFDQKFLKEQRDLLEGAYSAVRTIRLLFQNHPKVKSVQITISDTVREGNIVSW
jgi:hypothetical protein